MTTLTTGAAPSGPGGRPASGTPLAGAGPLTTSLVFAGRSLRHSLRDGEGLVMAIALPVALMAVFTVVFGGALDRDGGYVDYVAPGIILLCAGFGAASVATSVNRDVTAGAMDRFRSLPIAASTAILGHVVASVARNLVATAVVVLAGLAFGFRPTASPLDWLVALVVVALYITAVTVLFAFVGLVTSSPEAASGAGFALMFLPYLSSAFVPVDTMPEWLRPFALHQPVTPVIETIRGLLLGGDAPLGLALAWCAAIAAVGGVLAVLVFPRRRGR